MAYGKHRENHGMTGTRIHNIWRGMKIRCYDENRPDYQHYGGRGIRMCEEWRTSFNNFYTWAKHNGYQDNLTIDRINVDESYSPENCRWATLQVQENNRTNNKIIAFNGQSHTQAEWSQIIGIDQKTISARIVRYGWSIERALTTPKRRRTGGHYV